MVLEMENFSTFVPKSMMVPAVEAIPNRADKIQTAVLRAVMVREGSLANAYWLAF
jgi:hypothetical protein